MVTDTKAVAAVTRGPDGILAGLGPGSSTSTCRRRRRRTAARLRPRSRRSVPACSTHPSRARSRRSSRASSRSWSAAAARPSPRSSRSCSTSGPSSRWVGENGQAVLLKIAINLSVAVQMVAFSEGLLLAEKAGIDRELALERDAQLGDREPDAQLPGAVRPRSARGGVVRLQPDAEGPASSRSRRAGRLDVPDADDRGRERADDAARGLGSTEHDFAIVLRGARPAGRHAEGGRADGRAASPLPVERGLALDDGRADAPDPRVRGAANELYLSAKMPGLTHLYVGEEAVAVGVCTALRRDDTITSTHRGHGHCLAKGADVRLMFAELLGKEEGYCRGKGGSMHIADHAQRQPRRERDRRRLGRDRDRRGVLAPSGSAPTSVVGLLLRRGRARPGAPLRGDEHGRALEAAGRSTSARTTSTTSTRSYDEVTAGSIPARAEAFGIPAEEVDGQDVVAVHEAAMRAVERARAGDGPSFLLGDTYRYHGHHVGDVDRAYYRSKEEEERLGGRARSDRACWRGSAVGDDAEARRAPRASRGGGRRPPSSSPSTRPTRIRERGDRACLRLAPRSRSAPAS